MFLYGALLRETSISDSYQAIVSSLPEAETISKSPSPSISATWTSCAPSTPDPRVTAAANEGSAAPSFSYQTIVSACWNAAMTSKSPSLSKSARKTSLSSFPLPIEFVVQVGSAAPLFSCQAILP